MTITTGDHVRVRLVYDTPGGHHAENVYHFKFETVATIADSIALDDFELWAIAWATLWGDFATTATEMVEVQVSKFTGAEFQSIGGRPIQITGTVNSDTIPHGCAGLIRVLLDGSSGQGRKFIPGMAESRQQEGVIGSNGLVALAQMALLYIVTVTNTSVPGVFGQWAPEVFQQQGATFVRILGTAFVESVVAYMRSRKQNVGI